MNLPTSTVARQLSLAALLLGMPCLAIATLANLVLQAGTIDAYIYTGLLHDYTQVLHRYGSTYYANRVAFTVPARAAIALLGDRGGHFLFETGYLFAATVSGFAIGRRYFSTAVGIAAAAWVAFNPWLIRGLAWDYIEGASVCAMLVAFCCFLLNGRRPILLHIAGGIVFALACNMNQIVCAMALALTPAWLILNLPRGARHCVICAAAALAAFVIGYAGLLLVEYLEMPALGFGRELVTLSVAMGQLQGGAADWFRPISGYLAEGHIYILVPVFLALGLAVLIATEHTTRMQVVRFNIAAAICIVLTSCVYLLFHEYFRAGIPTVFWYDGYAFPAGLLAIIGLLGTSVGTLPPRTARLICAAAALVFALLWVAYAAWQPLLGLATDAAFAAFAGVLAVSLGLVRFSTLRAVSAVASAVLAIVLFYFPVDQRPARAISPEHLAFSYQTANHYAALHDSAWQAPDRDLYQGALFLQRVISQSLPISEGPVGFWYGSEDAPFQSIQSVFLWGYSNIISPALPHNVGEHLGASLRQKLAPYSHIVILSRTNTDGDAAMQALGADGAVARLRGRYTFDGSWFSFVVTVVDYVPPAGPVGAPVTQVPINRLAAQNGATLATVGNAVQLSTAPEQWSYSALMPLGADSLPAGKLVLRARLRVVSGQIGVLVTPNVSSPQVVEAGAGPSAVPRDVDLAIPDGSAEHLLVIRNWAPSGPSLVQIFSIEVFRAAP